MKTGTFAVFLASLLMVMASCGSEMPSIRKSSFLAVLLAAAVTLVHAAATSRLAAGRAAAAAGDRPRPTQLPHAHSRRST